MKRLDAWMNGVIKTPHYDIHQVYTIEKCEKNTIPKRGKVPPTREKKKGDKVISPINKECQAMIAALM